MPKKKAELGDVFELWTPSEVQNYCNLVANGFKAMSTDLTANPVLSPAELAAWNKLYKDFLNFYLGIGFFSRLTISTVRTAESYAKQLAYWRQLYKTKYNKDATGANVVIPAEQNSQILSTAKVVAIAASIGLVAIFGTYALYKFKH